MLQELSTKCIRHLGIVGECNIQYAFNSDTDDYRVIEVNARLSRSSALASKATGYPLAFVAAKVALGYTLDQIGEMGTPNSAYVAPQLDYYICKIPRWDLTKFAGVSREIGSSMKSVGEIMSIGRSFEEIIQKGLRMIGQGMHGFVGNDDVHFEDLDKELSHPTDLRIFALAQAMEEGYTIERIHELTKIDPWFLGKLKNIVDYKAKLSAYDKVEDIPSVVPEDIRLSGLIPRAAGADDGIQRFVHLHVYLAELVLGAILVFYATRRAVLAYSALYYHDIGFHGAVRLPAEYESKVRERVGGRLYRWLRLPVVPIYLYQWADLGEQVQRYLR